MREEREELQVMDGLACHDREFGFFFIVGRR